MPDFSPPLLRVEGLKKHFVRHSFLRKPQITRAVDGVDFTIMPGHTLGVVGESGSGKTTLSRLVMRLLPASEGQVFFKERDVFALGAPQMKRLRREMQIVFQNPFGSLDPRQSIESIVEEPMIIHDVASPKERRQRVTELLDLVGIPDRYRNRFPHQFSGGQRQRIGIARALALKPAFLVCDEPVSALDVSVKAQIINLLLHLQQELKLTYMFVSHDLNLVQHISDDVIVMYLGQLVEYAPNPQIYDEPMHPYTEALLAASPRPDPDAPRNLSVLRGEVFSSASDGGCRFRARCDYARSECAQEPPWKEWKPSHWARCWRIADIRHLQQRGST